MAITGSIQKVNDTVTISYEAKVQTYTIPVTGLYKCVLNGASGGTQGGFGWTTGQGGTTTLHYKFDAGTILYTAVGGAGETAGRLDKGRMAGGYNGGADGMDCLDGTGHESYSGGGGATHIASAAPSSSTTTTPLANTASSQLYAVAGGGGGGKTFGRWDGSAYVVDVFEGGAGNYSSASGAYGKGSEYGGGGGYKGGPSSWQGIYGGSGYLIANSYTYKGTTYQNTITLGGSGGRTNGSIKITLLDNSGLSFYIGTKEVINVYVGTKEVIQLFRGTTQIG